MFLVDWGCPDEEDADMGLDEFVLRRARLGGPRDAPRRRAPQELTLMGWCMGATLCAMYCGLDRAGRRAFRCATWSC